MNHDPKEQRAVALRYHADTPAPFLVAKGRGQLAARLKKLAISYGIPIMPDRELSDALFVLDVGQTIPEELYQVVAELFAFVYQVTGERKNE